MKATRLHKAVFRPDIAEFFMPVYAGMRNQNILNMIQTQTLCSLVESQPTQKKGLTRNIKRSNMTKNIMPIVKALNGQATTTSLNIAEVFGKNHRDVLEKIQKLTDELSKMDGQSNERNFTLVEYTDAKGESRPMYELTRDGFTLLAMGFTGKKALEFKLAYIDQFNKMEQALKSPDFERTLTVVKQHSRKLPTVRVKKEITLPQKQMGTIGAMIKNCVHAEMEQYLKEVKEPSFDFGQAYNTAKGNAEKSINDYNRREFMDASDAIRKFGYACYNMGTLDAVANLMKQGKITER